MENFLGSVNLDSSMGAKFPALPPPPGVSPSFTNPYSQGDTYTGVATTIIVAMILLVTIRQYTKYFIVRKLAWDDCKLSSQEPNPGISN